jgi:hypothetical protein
VDFYSFLRERKEIGMLEKRWKKQKKEEQYLVFIVLPSIPLFQCSLLPFTHCSFIPIFQYSSLLSFNLLFLLNFFSVSADDMNRDALD